MSLSSDGAPMLTMPVAPTILAVMADLVGVTTALCGSLFCFCSSLQVVGVMALATMQAIPAAWWTAMC